MTLQKFVIQKAQCMDFINIRNLLSENNLPTNDLNEDSEVEFLIIQDEGALIGIVGLESYGDVGLLRSLAVQETHRHQGIAMLLLSEIEKIAIANKFDSLYLLTISASNFFIKNNYQIINRELVPTSIRKTKQFTDLCPTSAICMVKKING